MNVFDIIGPIMIGPSSSHTAGACRIGNYARIIARSCPKACELYFSGSFAKTYKGHGTDKAVVAGLLGFAPSDERLRDSFEYAKKEGMSVKVFCKEIELAHPNTVRIVLTLKDNHKYEIIGSSIGGGNILLTNINGIPVEIDGMYDTFIIGHKDIPGMITKIAKVFSDNNINVNGLKLFRIAKGDEAYVIVQVDNEIDDETLIYELQNIEYVTSAVLLGALREKS